MKYILHLMIALFFFLVTITASFAQGDAPTLFQGDGGTVKRVGATVVLPNNQVTKITASKARLETGNQNILLNPSFETAAPGDGWSVTGNAGSPLDDGLQSFSKQYIGTAVSICQDSTLFANAFSSGNFQGVARATVNGTGTGVQLYLCPRKAGATVAIDLCKPIDSLSTIKRYEIAFTLGGTSNGMCITSNGVAYTGFVLVDNAYVASTELKAAAPQISTQSVFGSVSASSVTSLAGTAVGSGLFTTSGGTLTALTRISVTGTLYASMTSTAVGNFVQASVSGNTQTIAASATAQTLQASSASTKILNAGDTMSFSIGGSPSPTAYGFTITAYSVVNTATYSSVNADVGWAPCNFSTLAWQGLGTVSHSLLCKRSGEDLIMRGRVNTGTTAASIAQIPLPTWNGSQLVTADTSKVNASYDFAGRIARNVITTNDFSALLQASQSYLNIGIYNSAGSAPHVAINGNAAFNTADVFWLDNLRIPINGWDQSNIIIGQFNGLETCANTYECTDTFVANISSAGVVSGENVDWINGNCSVATAEHTCTYLTNTLNGGGVGLSSGMVCVGIDTSSTTTAQPVRIYSSTTTGFVGSSNSGRSWSVSCRKTYPDYVAKSAKAVASDQNTSVTGKVKYKECRIRSNSACTTATCDLNNYTIHGGCVSSITRSAAGTYVINFNTSYWSEIPICIPGMFWSGSTQIPGLYGTQTLTSLQLATFAAGSTGTLADANYMLSCTGTVP